MSGTKIAALWIASLALVFAVGRQLDRPASHAGAPPEAMGAGVLAALEHEDPAQGVVALAQWLTVLDRTNVSGAVEAFEEVLFRVEEPEVRLLADRWTRIDPEAAFAHLRGWPIARRKWALSTVFRVWGERDPSAARAAIRTLARSEPEQVRVAAQSNLVHGWTRSGDPGVWTYLASFVDVPNLANRLTTQALFIVSRNEGTDAVVERVESALQEGDALAPILFRAAIVQVAGNDGPRAAAWVDAHADRSYADGAAVKVATGWMQNDADATFGWLETRPAEERRDAIQAGFARWLERDRDAAIAWLEAVERGPMHDAAIAEVFNALVLEPELAIRWAERLQNSDERRRRLVSIGQRWMKLDPEASQKWLRTSELSSDDRARVRQSAVQSGRGAGSARPAEAG
jgi:hypothetical protein